MNTVLKFDKVILVKPLNEKLNMAGKEYEIASILEDSFLLRDSNTKVAIGVVSFKDLEKYFVKEEEFNGWTSWTPLTGFNNQTDCFYRTNRKKVQVKFLTDKVRGESCCNKMNEFNLYFGIQVAYLRCFNKAQLKRKAEYEEKIKEIDIDVADNENILKKMINSLKV